MPQTSHQTMRARVEAFSARLTLVPNGGAWRIVASDPYADLAPRERVFFEFDVQPDGRPFVVALKNGSDYAGWGRHMVLALAEVFPGHTMWPSTRMQPSGVGFWTRIAQRDGIRIEALCAVNDLQRDDSGAFGAPPHPAGTLDDLDRAVAARARRPLLRRLLRR